MSVWHELKRRNVLRVAAAYVVVSWLLIQVVETILPLFGYDDTPARIVVIMLVIGFIPVMVFAWAFEITPEGLKRDADVVHDTARAGGKKLDRAILVLLALSVAYFAFDKFVLDPSRDQSIAVSAREEGRTSPRPQPLGSGVLVGARCWSPLLEPAVGARHAGDPEIARMAGSYRFFLG